MRFLVIEGLDGSGKSTQVDLLKAHLEKLKIKYNYLHFPRLEEGVYGKLIARFLRGEMGEIGQVDPYLVALIFAGDRKDAKPLMEQWMKDDHLVIVDRYVYSNIAFQCAKLGQPEDQNLLAEWIMELEYGVHKLPVPDINVFLDVPFDFTRRRLSSQRTGEDRNYLKGAKDIHENDLPFQERVRVIYHSICSRMGNLQIVNCADDEGRMKSPEEVFLTLKQVIEL
ncbi:MAG: dTMP kinase [Bacteroidales bacterium]|nr:dTMP kinase [Bacteroidales bacterium]